MVQLNLVQEGCSFWGHVFVCPPELHETGTIRKHWNRATIYAETKRVYEQLGDTCSGMGTKKLQKIAKHKDPLCHVVINQQSWCSFFANHPGLVNLIS